ncbi:hypothetical protein BDB00DRAFT_580860 [Zychaea mexicana]|uniref:uncharacterized protein n=1 Tax=Zychaea mexicana TaxID=64656 RepID=UPI0022FDED1B|nr:uncharacterized protein BDB00DRAFT_580860 [Zychaea mexicana]KAI9497562.1 hypothetical protein BDB00DRAFT_580860 [Zychaea mexicana]
MWNIEQNTLTDLELDAHDPSFNAILDADQSVVTTVDSTQFPTPERTESTSVETTHAVELTTPDAPLFSSSVGDASASSTAAAEAQTEEEPTATAATTDYVGRKRARQAGVPGHTDDSYENGANTGQSENQSTACLLEGKNPKRMETEELATFYSNQQGQNQLAAQETAGAPVVKEEHTENACERKSFVESPPASQETHPTAIDTSETQPSAQRTLNEQPSTSASLPLVRKRARENDSGVTEQPNTELPPEQSSPKRTKTNEVAASSLTHQEQQQQQQQQQQPQTAASSALSSRHQGGQQQPIPQQQSRASVGPSSQLQEQQNQTSTGSSRHQEQQQRQELQAQAPVRVPEGVEGDLLCPYRGCNRSYSNAQERRFFSHLKKRHGAVIPRIHHRNEEQFEKIYKNRFGTELNFQRYAGVPRTLLDEGDPITVETVPIPRARAGRRAVRGDNTISVTFSF